jgi:hypothetical protein
VGLEPTRLSTLEPKSSASANFATPACLTMLPHKSRVDKSSANIFQIRPFSNLKRMVEDVRNTGQPWFSDAKPSDFE